MSDSIALSSIRRFRYLGRQKHLHSQSEIRVWKPSFHLPACLRQADTPAVQHSALANRAAALDRHIVIPLRQRTGRRKQDDGELPGRLSGPTSPDETGIEQSGSGCRHTRADRADRNGAIGAGDTLVVCRRVTGCSAHCATQATAASAPPRTATLAVRCVGR